MQSSHNSILLLVYFIKNSQQVIQIMIRSSLKACFLTF